jgi:hypothetical protein
MLNEECEKMKIRKIVFWTMILTYCGLIIGTYYLGTNLASDKIIESVSKELEAGGKLEEIKDSITEDPELMEYLGLAASSAEASDDVHSGSNKPAPSEADKEKADLPFTTKEEATRVLIKKVGLTRIQDIHTEVVEGTVDREDIIKEIESKLSEDEIKALKVIAIKELAKKQN